MTCPDRDKNKNRYDCVNCEKRLAYVTGLGEMTHNVPVEMGDMMKSDKTDIWRPLFPEGGKVCNDPDCHLAGRAQPLKNFYKSKKSISSKNPEGYVGKCKECHKRRYKEKKGAKKTAHPPLAAAPDDTNKAEEKLVIFTPEMAADIEKIAALELRSVENQVIFMLRQSLDKAKRYWEARGELR